MADSIRNLFIKNKRYKHLKKYWKRLQNKTSDINYDRRYWCPSFKDYLTQSEIINRLLSYHPELRQGYDCYQSSPRVLDYSENSTVQKERIEAFQELLSLDLTDFIEQHSKPIKNIKRKLFCS
ncbi:hypothetical protein P7H74_03520 [Enterococcus devriesei]|uniref:hypothetical protein n=1 Tax=Enterococcus devriesei TaxID=319970 RepID=UPI0028903686|nr:hypothetical protein [Enterococcus devriesei]MDT2820813.1 hypothetical protein [Enterococcus devriesei]